MTGPWGGTAGDVVAVVLCGLLTGICAAGPPGLPLEFDRDAGWEPRPTYLGNPAARPVTGCADGVVTLRVEESGRGMKFEHAVRPFDTARRNWLVLRYRARNLGPGYALWINDDSPDGRRALSTDELAGDGAWHTLAVNLTARGVTGCVSSILTEVQAAAAPAEIAFDYVRRAVAPPAGVPTLPLESATNGAPDVTLRGRELARVDARPGWLDAAADTSAATVEGDALHLSAEGDARGMKWWTPLPAPVDLRPYRFAILRYRARGLAPWTDYAVWLAGAGAGGRRHEQRVVTLAELVDDDGWRTLVLPLSGGFTAAELAVQVSSRGALGELWLDRLTFSREWPALGLEDQLPLVREWEASRLPAGAFRACDLAAVANLPALALAPGLELARWTAPGRVTIRGIPFELSAASNNVLATSADLAAFREAPVGAAGSELYLLLAAELPDTSPAGILGRRALQRFDNPERFVLTVRYADGVVDEQVPVCLGSGLNEIRRGCGVYAVTCLRAAAVVAVGLRSGMEPARFALAGLTLNTGPALTPAPAVYGLPPPPAPPAAAWRTPALPSAITPVVGGYRLAGAGLTLDLQTVGGLALRGLASPGVPLACVPGPLFELGTGALVVASDRLATGEARVTDTPGGPALRVPFTAVPAGVPLGGTFHALVETGGAVRLWLDLAVEGTLPATPVVNFPLLRGLCAGGADETWYLWACKGGIVGRAPVRRADYYGGQYPLQVADIFNPASGGGLALLTRDNANLYKQWCLEKRAAGGVDWSIRYWARAHQPGEVVRVAPTLLQAHAGDWRAALGLYRDWVRTWYRPVVARKRWFQDCYNYRQHLAWGDLRDRGTGQWRLADVVRADRDCFGRLDYLHIFDFGESRVHGRVGDYSHYDELGGRAAMAAAIVAAQADGVPVGVYIEGYLCDERAAWGRANVLANNLRTREGTSLLYPGTTTEHMMCPAADAWRTHLADTYRRVAGELRPSGMYIDQYGFTDTWKTCWSRTHGHPVPWPALPGEGDTTRAIRASVPPGIATLTEETPNDWNAQFQDGALGYSVALADPVLAPHRVDLFRFMFPDFKVFQLVSYNPFVEGGWELLKFPFFNGEGTWTCSGAPEGFDPAARAFLRRAFAILHEQRDAFASADVEPLVQTLAPTLYANRFRAGGKTVWTLYNAAFTTFRGDALRVPYAAGLRYAEAFSGGPIQPRVEGAWAVLPLTLGPRAVGCVVAEAL